MDNDNDDDNGCDDDDDDDDIDSANIPKSALAVYASPLNNTIVPPSVISSALAAIVEVHPYASCIVTFLYIRIAADTLPLCPSAVSIEFSS
jgi:hypothetical protein